MFIINAFFVPKVEISAKPLFYRDCVLYGTIIVSAHGTVVYENEHFFVFIFIEFS